MNNPFTKLLQYDYYENSLFNQLKDIPSDDWKEYGKQFIDDVKKLHENAIKYEDKRKKKLNTLFDYLSDKKYFSSDGGIFEVVNVERDEYNIIVTCNSFQRVSDEYGIQVKRRVDLRFNDIKYVKQHYDILTCDEYEFKYNEIEQYNKSFIETHTYKDLIIIGESNFDFDYKQEILDIIKDVSSVDNIGYVFVDSTGSGKLRVTIVCKTEITKQSLSNYSSKIVSQIKGIQHWGANKYVRFYCIKK